MPINVGTTELCALGDIKVGSQNSLEVFAGADKVFPCAGGTGQCLVMDETVIRLPWGLAGATNTTNWYWEVEINTEMADSPYGIPIWRELYQVQGVLTERFRFAMSYFSIDRTQPGLTYASSIGSTSLFPPAQMERNKWVRLRYGRWDGSVRVQMEDENGISNATFFGDGSELTAVQDHLFLGHGWDAIDINFVGQMRNAKLVVDDVILGDWPILGQPLGNDVIIDVSGNDNHGNIVVAGGGTWEPCP